MGMTTGTIYKGLTFDGVNSKDYGVYITGAGVFSSPERDVELVSIPGRNGAFAVDRGRFSNIQVTYPAGVFGVDPAGFADAISDFRNALGSRVGYCRLEDDYNPDEYREAVFKAGLNVDAASLEAGEFEITFECKPQRFLKSGEDPQSVSSGGTITNPTLFDARPVLQVWGYGDISINGQTLRIYDTTIGDVNVFSAQSEAIAYWYGTFDDTSLFNPGDTITVEGIEFTTRFQVRSSVALTGVSNPTVLSGTIDNWAAGISNLGARLNCKYGWNSITFTAGTTSTVSASVSVSTNAGTYTAILQLSAKYDADDHSITIMAEVKNTSTILGVADYTDSMSLASVRGYSTKQALGSPLYFDLDIGEAYTIEGATPVSVNNAVSIPAALPTLPPGNTSITYDGTITQLKITPRWWKL